MIQAGRLNIEWFGSIKSIRYNFARAGLNTIQGLNGAGKSSIFNALSWCVYKQTLKKKCTIEPWPHIIDETYKGTKVTFEWQDDKHKYEVIRCANYKPKVLGKRGKNRVIFLVDGKEHSSKGKRDIQPEIIKAWGYSFDLFKSAVVFGQRIKRFMEEDGPAKKRIFDEAFESAFISRARDIVSKRIEQKEKDYDKLRTEKEAIGKQLGMARSHYKELRKITRLFKQTQREKIIILRKEAEELKKQIENSKKPLAFKNLPKLLRTVSRNEALYTKRYNQHLSREFDLTLRINHAQTELDKQEKELKDLKDKLTQIPENCKTCGQKIPKEKRLKYKKGLFQEIKALKERIEESEIWVKGLEEKRGVQISGIEKWAEKLKKVKAKKQKYAKAEIKMVQYEEQIKSSWALYYSKQEQISQIKKEKVPGKNSSKARKEVLKQKHDLRKVQGNFKEANRALRIDKWLIKDPLSNSGLKSFIFDSMIGRVNNYLQAYKTLIGFEVRVGVDMQSARKDIDITIMKNGDEVPYEDLSGGQGQLAGVAILFALSDVVQANKPINILLMDEAFESLDRENTPKVEDIIIKKSKNKCIHLITHNDNFNPLNAYRTMLELDGGLTKISNRYRDN